MTLVFSEVKMNKENSSAQEKINVGLLANSFEALCLSDFYEESVDSHSEVFDVKKILSNTSVQSNKIKTENNLCNIKDRMYSKVQHINISYSGLIEIPDLIFSFKYLTVLNLSNNFLKDLPKELGNLCNLLVLKLSGNKLKSLPKSLKNVQQLNYLDLSCNNFSEVPDVLCCGLRTLAVLDLSCNEITKFIDPPGCLNNLVALSLSDNCLEQVPVWIFDNLCQLQFLDISKNKLSFENKPLNYCKTGIYESLQFLNIMNCNLSYRNLEILSVFKKLKILHLGNGRQINKKAKGINYMGNFNSDEFKNFNEMTDLHLQNLQIATLPTDFDIVKNIEMLDLSYNLLSWLPESFCNLTNMKKLFLTSNQLLFLPINIGNLVKLKEIHLANNKLSQIPETFYNLKNLEFIDLYDNEIEAVDPKIFKENYLKGMDLGLNCLLFGFCKNTVDGDEVKMLYSCLRDSFRKHFCSTETRCDLQMSKSGKDNSETGSNSNSYSNQCSATSFESEPLSDFEELSQSMTQQNHNDDDDDDWDSYQIEKDEMFDPNEMFLSRKQYILSGSYFQNNYCPANSHVPPVMKTYINSFKAALKNEVVEEGQFDSD